VRVGEGIANVVTAAAAARVKDSRPLPHVGLPAAPLSSMIATPITARPSPHVGIPVAPLSSMIATPVTVIITGNNFRRSKSAMYPLSFALPTTEIVLVVLLTLVTNPPSLFPTIN